MSAKISVWTPEVLAELAAFAAPYGSKVPWKDCPIVRRGVANAGATQLRWSRLRRQGMPVLAPDLAPVDVPDPLEVAAQRRARLQEIRGERELLEAVAGEKSLRAFLGKLAEETALVLPPPPRYVAPKIGKNVVQETVIQVLCDWHGGEIVTAERTRGFNEYSTVIMAQRAKQVVKSHLSIKTKLERGGWSFPKLVLAVNGDFCSGVIHDLERHSDAKNVVMAVYGIAMVLAQAIRDFAAQYPEVEVYCISGNHGRMMDARKMQQKDPSRNWDTMIALLAQESLRQVKNVAFIIPDSYAVGYVVEGHQVLQMHGHDVRSFGGIPWYGINRTITGQVALESSQNRRIDYVLLSHFHTASSMEIACAETFISGSLIGATEYTINALGKADTPSQLMLCVHRDHGVTSRWPLIAVGGNPEDTYALPDGVLR